MPTLIDEKIKYRDFFSDNEMIFYKDLNELIDKVNFYKRNEEKRIKIGINGKIKYQKIFNNRIVSDYIISKTLNIKSRYKNVWEN
jgi:spore maturation protein CgeB